MMGLVPGGTAIALVMQSSQGKCGRVGHSLKLATSPSLSPQTHRIVVPMGAGFGLHLSASSQLPLQWRGAGGLRVSSFSNRRQPLLDATALRWPVFRLRD